MYLASLLRLLWALAYLAYPYATCSVEPHTRRATCFCHFLIIRNLSDASGPGERYASVAIIHMQHLTTCPVQICRFTGL